VTEPIIGSVAVDVVPSSRAFVEKLRGSILPDASRLGDQIGELMGARIASKVGTAIDKGIRSGNPVAQGGKQGDLYGGAFGDAVTEKIRRALAKLPTAKIDADLKPAEQQLAKLRTQLGTLGKTVGVHITDDAAVAVINHLKTRLDELTGPGHDIRVRVDAAAASAELAALQAQLGLVETESKKATDLGIKPLRDAILLLGPALIPLSGAVVGFGAGFVGLGGTAVLAVKGISNEMKSGSAEGRQYAQGLALIKTDLAGLEQIAARGVLAGFNRSIADASAEMPHLRDSVSGLSTTLGDLTAHTLHGIIAGFDTFNPLIQHTALYLDSLSARFDKFASGAGGAHFAQTLGQDFDQVIPVLEHLVEAAGRVVAAFAPVGSEVVGGLGALADVINAIPLPVLQALAVTFTSLYAANRLSGVFDGISVKLLGLSENSVLANTRVGQLSGSLGGVASKVGVFAGIGIAVYTAGKAISDYIERNNAGIQALDHFSETQKSFRTALEASNGVVDKATRSAAEYALEQAKLPERALKASITSDQLTQAITGTDQQYQNLIETWQASGAPSKSTIFALDLQRAAFLSQQAAVQKAVAAQRELADTQPDVWRGLNTTSASVQVVADKLGLSSDQVVKFAGVLGITKDQIDSGALSTGRLADAVSKVSAASATGSASVTTYMQALSAFSQSAKGAADRATLVGETLRAANGDALSYSAAISGSVQANLALTNAISDQAAEAVADATGLRAAETALGQAQRQASAGVANAIDQVASSERSLTQAQAAARNAQLALTAARKAAKEQLEDLRNQIIDGQLSERQAVLSLAQAKKNLAANPNDPQAKLDYDQAVQQLAEIRLQNQRLADEKKQSDKDGIEGSAQVVAAQQNIAQSIQAVTDAQTALAKSQQGVVDAQLQGAQAVASAQAAVSAAADKQAKDLKASELAAIDAKTGLIDLSKEGAAPLIEQLQGIQDGAVKAAAAIYQHELATGHDTTALSDAYDFYVSHTQRQLEDQLTKLGLSAPAAHRVAEEYLGIKNVGDIENKISSPGADQLSTVLDKLGQLLANLTGQVWTVPVLLQFDDDAAGLQKALRDNKAAGFAASVNRAMGGYVSGPGTGTSDSINARLSNGEFVVNANATKVFLPMLSKINRAVPAFAGGGLADNRGKAQAWSAALGSQSQTPNVTVQQTINNPLPERASQSGPAGLRRAAYALGAS